MSELEDRLSAVLNDPQAMGRIMALAQSLSGQAGGGPQREQLAPAEDASRPPPEPERWEELLGNVDPKMVSLGMRLMREYGRNDDRCVALLAALRPFVKEERFAKVDRALRIARLSRVVRVLLDALRAGGEEQGV